MSSGGKATEAKMGVGIDYVLVFLASFMFVMVKAFQQLNVQHDKFAWVVPTSMTMAVCEVFVIANIAHNGWGWIVIPTGLGSGLGCVVAMVIHRRLRG